MMGSGKIPNTQFTYYTLCIDVNGTRINFSTREINPYPRDDFSLIHPPKPRKKIGFIHPKKGLSTGICG
jgi:hypothetical protein